MIVKKNIEKVRVFEKKRSFVALDFRTSRSAKKAEISIRANNTKFLLVEFIASRKDRLTNFLIDLFEVQERHNLYLSDTQFISKFNDVNLRLYSNKVKGSDDYYFCVKKGEFEDSTSSYININFNQLTRNEKVIKGELSWCKPTTSLSKDQLKMLQSLSSNNTNIGKSKSFSKKRIFKGLKFNSVTTISVEEIKKQELEVEHNFEQLEKHRDAALSFLIDLFEVQKKYGFYIHNHIKFSDVMVGYDFALIGSASKSIEFIYFDRYEFIGANPFIKANDGIVFNYKQLSDLLQAKKLKERSGITSYRRKSGGL